MHNKSAQIIILDSVRHVAEEYGYQSDPSRGKMSAWMCITIVASISTLVMCLCYYPVVPHSVEQMLAVAQLKARAARAAWPTSQPHQHSGPSSDAASVTNDRLTRRSAGAWCTTPPAEQRRRLSLEPARFCPQPIVPTRSVLQCTLSGTVSRGGQSVAASAFSCTDGTPLFLARADGGDSAVGPRVVISLETVPGEEQVGSLPAREAERLDQKVEITRAREAKSGSLRAKENGGHITTGKAGEPLLLFCHQAHDLHMHDSGGHDLHARGIHMLNLHEHDSSGAALAEVKPSSSNGTCEVRVSSSGDASTANS